MKIKPQESWDNSGLQIGSLNKNIKNIMLTLDMNSYVLKYAVNNNIDLIITHHPFLFSGVKSIDFNTYEGSVIKEMIINDISLYSMHTSFDMATYGVNHKLAEKLNIVDYHVLHEVNIDLSGYGGIGTIDAIEPVNIVEYAKIVKEQLNADHVKLFCNDEKKSVKRVAFCGGSGSDFIDDAIQKKADVYITGDIKYHQAQTALRNNLCIVDAGHYYTEYHAITLIKDVLDKIGELNIVILENNTVREIII